MKVMAEFRYNAAVRAAAVSGIAEPSLTASIAAATPEFVVDPSFPPVQLPSVRPATGGYLSSLNQRLVFALEPEVSTYLMRGSIPDEALPQSYAKLLAHPDVVGVHSDPVIESCIVCPGTPPVGTDADVATMLDAQALHAAGMDGHNVFLAVVDTGINVAYLRARGRHPHLVTGKSWAPAGVTTKAGQHPVDHGTMCAYDAGIAAPNAQLLDYAVLLSKTPGTTVMAGLLSDAVLAYSKLRQVLMAMPASKRAMVITNSWGMFSPAWDFPPGHPGNYSDNPNHPFNIIVASLEHAGADILFAAGNCGRDCPDARCAFTDQPICGANSHPRVISVAGVDTTKSRVGYSSQGPGRLMAQKPDIASYTHFAGSGVYTADGGTSAACPVAAGVVAAVRSKYPATSLSPAELRALLFRSAKDVGRRGFDFNCGWGIINPAALINALATVEVEELVPVAVG